MGIARLSLVILSLSLALPASAEDWKSYVNGRFGAAAEYPARFLLRTSSGNGRNFKTADGRASLWILGFYRIKDQTPQSLIETRRAPGVVYNLTTADGGAITMAGRRGGQIVYERCLKSGEHEDIYVCIDIEYPAAEKANWDPIVARIAGSLRAEKPYQADR